MGIFSGLAYLEHPGLGGPSSIPTRTALSTLLIGLGGIIVAMYLPMFEIFELVQ